jgi:hypothetical protein
MNASAIRKIFTFSLKAEAISGNESLKTPQSKKVVLTSSQPGLRVIARATSATKTTVETTATAAARPGPPPRSSRIRERRSSSAR